MGLREVKAELNKLQKDDLIKHISELYKKYKPVKDYFEFYIHPDEKKLVEEYKEKISLAFFPVRGYDFKLSVARKAISEFKKLGTSAESNIDLLIHFVENGVELTLAYGDIGESFYTSMENTYEKALNLASKNGLLAKFKARANKIVESTEKTGYGFQDTLGHFYAEHYEN